jgi:hypothetical protein
MSILTDILMLLNLSLMQDASFLGCIISLNLSLMQDASFLGCIISPMMHMVKVSNSSD